LNNPAAIWMVHAVKKQYCVALSSLYARVLWLQRDKATHVCLSVCLSVPWYRRRAARGIAT